MANLPETAQWEAGVYQLETTDPVEGGPNGIDNEQAKQLANRTAFLKGQLEAKTGQATETTAGIAEVATQSETDAGTDDTRIVTPKKLKAWLKQATETVLGALKIA
ncbi:hypothetical protein P8629_01365, partial [Hydrogenovibrio sp. 3SP14C1]|uniref:hypothetical protein n=1 Tax=Hydrogenovibrio sp. 3SP14C1 TaxID=3038774 RepID=UPI0024172326